MNRWLVKQEPESYSWAAFVKEGKAAWTGVRNYQARNNLRAMKQGDLVLFLLDTVSQLDLSRFYAPYETETRGAPGSRAGLLPSSPLRTARESFPSSSSSLANAPCGTRSCHVQHVL